MADLETSQSAGERMDAGSRSQLLMPVMEGNTLETADVSGFLAHRLATVLAEIDEESDEFAAIKLS